MGLRPGEMLSHYRLVEKLGEGGMGVVYRARDERLRRPVALKILPPTALGDEDRRRRFLREARSAAAISHPGIVHVYEIDEADGVLFIAMELIEGRTLRRVMEGKPMPIAAALRIATEIVDGLARAHAANVVHRDLKPDNVMVMTDGHVKILDFGLAKQHLAPDESGRSRPSRAETVTVEMTHAGMLVGTPAYMSPEQVRGHELDPRSDIFAFGSTLYEMVTGRAAFHRSSVSETLAAIQRDDPPLPTLINPLIPPAVERLIMKCIQKDPMDRYQDADSVAADLRWATTSDGLRVDEALVSVVPKSLPLSDSRRPRPRTTRWWSWASSRRLQSGDRVFVADFAAVSGRADLVSAVRDTFECLLSQTTFLTVVRGQALKDATAASGIPAAVGINPKAAHRLCRDAGFAGFLTGSLETRSVGMRIEAKLFRGGRRRPVVVRSVLVSSEDDLLPALHRTVLDVRSSLGEAAETVSSTPPPTTRSLQAFRAYAIAQRVINADEAISLLQDAIEIDPTFVDAYGKLATWHSSGWNWRESRRFAQEAHQRSAGLTERQRLLNHIWLREAFFDFEKAIELLKTYQQLFPSDDVAPLELGWLHLSVYQDPATAEHYYNRVSKVTLHKEPVSAILSLALQRKVQHIEQLIGQLRELGVSQSLTDVCSLVFHVAREDWDQVNRTADLLEKGPGSARLLGTSARVATCLATGRIEQASRTVPAMWRAAQETRNFEGMYVAEVLRVWCEARRDRKRVALSDPLTAMVQDSLLLLPDLAALCIDVDLDLRLADLIASHTEHEKDSQSRFVKEELDYARACLALTTGDADRARSLLRPLAQGSMLVRRHRALGRAYEALGQWRDATAEYEEALSRPGMKWWHHENPAVFALDQFRCAGACERSGDVVRARHWYERFITDWRHGDPDIPELLQARKRLTELEQAERGVRRSP